MRSKTAILIFANSAKEEMLNKPFQGGGELFNELNQKTISIVESTNLPYYISTEKEQLGNSFGERFVHAIQEIYEKGYDSVITIGNDTPFLSKKHLLDTAEQLQKNKPVIGPSADGGFYLIGLHKSQFDITHFLKLPWQSNQLTKNIVKLLDTDSIETILLEVLYDIDSLNDLKFITTIKRKLSISLVKIINFILDISNKVQRSVFKSNYCLYTSTSYNKGSPIF